MLATKLLGAAYILPSTGVINPIGKIPDNDATLGNYTISNASLGTPNPNRKIVVCAVASNGHIPTSVTIGGVSCTALITSIGTIDAGIFYAAIPSGTNADIVITGQTGDGWSISWYRLLASSSAPVTTDSYDDLSAGTHSLNSLNYNQGACAIVVVSSRTDNTVVFTNSSGLSGMTIDFNMAFRGSTRFGCSASCVATETGINDTLNVTADDSSSAYISIWE